MPTELALVDRVDLVHAFDTPPYDFRAIPRIGNDAVLMARAPRSIIAEVDAGVGGLDAC